jgi:hypothetical protein
MKTAVEVIERALASGLLMPELIFVPDRGASSDEFAQEEQRLGRPLSASHRALLARWNGLDLEVLRFYGCGACGEVDNLSARQEPRPEGDGVVVVGSSPAGFVYAEDANGILSLDSKTMAVKRVAADLDDFVGRLVFGADASAFAGEEWAAEVRNAGLA